MSMLQVVTPNDGHTTEWDPDNPEQVATVRAEFDALMERGFVAFDDRVPTRTFNPDAATMLVTPIVVAG